jgi:GT2 family glycosyltransferase
MGDAAVAAIVVTRNSAGCLPVCLQSILASDYEPLRVIVVDNGSTDGTRSLIASSFPSVELIALNHNHGFAAANNVALRKVADSSDYAFLVNPDTRTPPSLLGSMADLMRNLPQVGVLGPLQHRYRTEGPNCTEQPNDWSRYMLERLGAHEFVDQLPDLPGYGSRIPDGDGLADVAFVQGAALFLRLDTLGRTGLFDETLFCFYDEVDLCRRIRWLGYRVCLAVQLCIEHLGGASTTADFLRVRLMMRNRYYYALTDPRLGCRTLGTLLAKFAKEDLGMLRSQRPARLLAFGLAWAWLLLHMPGVLSRRVAHGALWREGEESSASP